MTNKNFRRMYLAAKMALAALSAVTLFLGVHCLPETGDAGAPFFFWLSGMLLYAFATLEE